MLYSSIHKAILEIIFRKSFERKKKTNLADERRMKENYFWKANRTRSLIFTQKNILLEENLRIQKHSIHYYYYLLLLLMN